MSDQEIEREIQAKGLTAPRVTPADIEANIVAEYYFTAQEAMTHARINDDMVSRFLTWPVPAEVYPDGVAGQPGRTGTNLMTAEQARGMLEYVIEPPPVDAGLGLLTFCVLTLRCGYTVTGESACASPDNFDAELGRKIARQNAVGKVWPLMGYQLKCQLAEREAMLDRLPPVPEGLAAYTGTKQLFARPMTLGEYHDYREWEEIVGRDPDEPGYLVEYIDGGHPNDSRHTGYVSWSPAAVFERTYHPLTEAKA